MLVGGFLEERELFRSQRDVRLRSVLAGRHNVGLGCGKKAIEGEREKKVQWIVRVEGLSHFENEAGCVCVLGKVRCSVFDAGVLRQLMDFVVVLSVDAWWESFLCVALHFVVRVLQVPRRLSGVAT